MSNSTEGRELLRAHIEISRLRERNAALEHALRQAHAAIVPHAGAKGSGPKRKQVGTSPDGGPVYAD